MHPPAKRRPFVDEGLRCEIFHREPEKTNGTLENSLPPEELPAALPIYPRGRLVEPNAIVIHHAPRGENDRESVNHKRRVEVLQIARPTTMAATSRPVKSVAVTPARKRS